MNEEEFNIAKLFVQSVIDQFEIGRDKTRVAMISFGQEPRLEFDFNGPQESNEYMKRQVGNARYVFGTGRLQEGLQMVCQSMFCRAGGQRPGFPKVIL